MKKQTYGRILNSSGIVSGRKREWLENASQENYKAQRMNAHEELDIPSTAFPRDGQITWVKGRVEGDYVYGIKSGDNYEYECRYDEGPEDKKWMEECDRNYLARLFLAGTDTEQEQKDLAENREWAERSAKEVEALPIKQLFHALKERKGKKEKERSELERKVKEKAEREEKERKEREVRAEKERQEKQERERKRKEQEEFQAVKERRAKRNAAQRAKEKKALDSKLEEKLGQYRCSITHLIMLDPVMTCDGMTYEREAIEEWLKNHDTSPKTNTALKNKDLAPNGALKEVIQDLVQSHPELWASGEVYESVALEVQFHRAMQTQQLNELSRIISMDKRFLTMELQDQKSLLSLALEKKSLDMTRWTLDHLGKNIQHIPELEAKEGAKRLFRKAAYKLGTEGAKWVGEALGMKPSDYQSELWQGLQTKDAKLVQVALELKADPAELNSQGLKPIHVATEMENQDLVAVLAKFGQIDSDDANGNSALHRAITQNQLPQVRLLVANGANVSKSTPQGLSPLELSFEQIKTNRGSLKITEALLESKADPNVTDAQGQTLLLKSLSAGMIDFVRLLVQYGVNLNQANAKGEIPLHQAFLFHGKELYEALHALVQGKIDLEAKDEKGYTALLKAVTLGETKAVEVLLQAKANPEAVDAQGNTALHIAVEKGSEELVRLLLTAGASLEARNQANQKAIQRAKQAHLDRVVELFRTNAIERRIAPYIQSLLQPLKKQNADLRQQNADLEKRVTELEQKLKIGSSPVTPPNSCSSQSQASLSGSVSSFWRQSNQALPFASLNNGSPSDIPFIRVTPSPIVIS